MKSIEEMEKVLDKLNWAQGFLHKAITDYRSVCEAMNKRFPNENDFEKKREMARDQSRDLSDEFENTIRRVMTIHKRIKELEDEFAER